jgi:ArsR family transcriptional regulator, arsenate/arsenite/antimonite-responsive transcriptional repressor
MKDLCSEINKFGKGIGNEARYRILQALIKGDKTVTELVSIVDMSQPAISQHLKTLKESDLVLSQKIGQEVHYSLNAEHTLSLLTALVKDIAKYRPTK